MGADLPVFWEAAFAQFGEDQFAVHTHLKTASRPGDQGEAGDVLFVFLENVFRQTGGFGEIVSGGAVLESDFHGHS